MSKRENDSVSIKDLLGLYINEGKLKKGFQKIHIEEAWAKLMGSGVVNYTTEIKLQNGTLIVCLSSSVLREELSYGKEKIMRMMNDEMGDQSIRKIMLI